MLSKILPPEEEKEMEFIPAIAILVKKNETAQKIKQYSTLKIPRYLKRVNSTLLGTENILLVTFDSFTSVSKHIPVLVPSFEPITKKQFIVANCVWPCNFYNHFEIKIDQKLALFHVSTLLNYLTKHAIEIKKGFEASFCSGICMIFDSETLLSVNVDTEPIIGHAVLSSISQVSASEKGYLCTGYIAVIYREPCMSCAMAFVHGRIKNVLFITKVKNGSFSYHKLNYNHFLNHKYNTYVYECD
ncbi:adenosine deaminase [Glugoides intestinalis]